MFKSKFTRGWAGGTLTTMIIIFAIFVDIPIWIVCIGAFILTAIINFIEDKVNNE